MSNIQQVEENIESANRSESGILTSKELEIISKVQEMYVELGYIGCTKCLYCQPCPQSVLIPDIIEILNENYTSSREVAKKSYLDSIPKEGRASKCIQCGVCEEQCPQGLPIMNLMRTAARGYERN
jgi:predicted aldo/keto reductase-like oxidoreductase